MAADINQVRKYADEIRAQIKEKKRELRRLEKELKETDGLIKSFDAKFSKVPQIGTTKKKPKKPNNLERVMAVIDAGPEDGYLTRELSEAFEEMHGEAIRDTTLRSTLTVLRIEEFVAHHNKKWVFRKPYFKV